MGVGVRLCGRFGNVIFPRHSAGRDKSDKFKQIYPKVLWGFQFLFEGATIAVFP